MTMGVLPSNGLRPAADHGTGRYLTVFSRLCNVMDSVGIRLGPLAPPPRRLQAFRACVLPKPRPVSRCSHGLHIICKKVCGWAGAYVLAQHDMIPLQFRPRPVEQTWTPDEGMNSMQLVSK